MACNMHTTAPMNVERIDLNLLRVFDAVYEERNLLRAGRRHLGLEPDQRQPALLGQHLAQRAATRTP